MPDKYSEPEDARLLRTSLDPPDLESDSDYSSPAPTPDVALDDPSHRLSPSDRPTLAEIFRHSGWRRDRRRVWRALGRTRQSFSRVQAFASCGASAYVYRTPDPPHEYFLAGSSCHDRFCVPCARVRGDRLALEILHTLDGQPVRFLTLTIRHTDSPLSDQLDHLYASFRRLRATTLWKRSCSGGCAILEITHSDTSDAWHPHLHVLMHGGYISQSLVKAAWLKATGDSSIVDIRMVRSEDHIARYVSKYVAKPFDRSIIDREDLLDELIIATRNRRMVVTFGGWRGIRLTQTAGDHDWELLGSLDDVARAARSGDAESMRALRYVAGDRTDDVLDLVVAGLPPPRPVQAPDPQQQWEWAVTYPRY